MRTLLVATALVACTALGASAQTLPGPGGTSQGTSPNGTPGGAWGAGVSGSGNALTGPLSTSRAASSSAVSSGIGAGGQASTTSRRLEEDEMLTGLVSH